jgi:hypothetical protein
VNTQQVGRGAAVEWTERELGGPVNEVESLVTATSPKAEILGGNADRVAVVFVNTGSNDAIISLGGLSSISGGIRLAAQGGTMILTLRDDFTLPTRAFSGFASAGPSNIYILEYVRFRKAD